MSGLHAAKKSDDAEQEAWLITYADAITLIMLFFLLLLSMASFDVTKFEAAAEGIQRDVANREIGRPINDLKIDVQDVVFSMQADQVVSVSIDERGVVIELASGAFYRSGSAEFREEAVPVLQKIALLLASPRYKNFSMEVEGHTDDLPIKTERFPTNWELSASRAARVVRFLTAEGDESRRIDPRRTRAVGLAETRPKLPNRDEAGKPIPENQNANRRINIRVYPMSFEERKEFASRTKMEGTAGTPAQGSPPAAAALAPTSQSPPAPQPAPAAQTRTQR